MNLVALLTDFGLENNYAGVMKGVVLKVNPDAKIVDISHNVPSHNIREAAFLLASSFYYFPKDTVFLVVVDPGVGSGRKPVAVKTRNYYFVGPDNGVLSIAAGADRIERIVVLENKKYFLPEISFTFHGRDIFAPVAGHLSKKVSFSSLGKITKQMEEIDLPLPKIKKGLLEAEVIYVDKFGNLITNIEKYHLSEFLQGEFNRFVADLKGKSISKIRSSYIEGRMNEPFFIEGSSGYLEISLKNKSAEKYFALKKNRKQKIIIRRAK